MQEIDEKLSPEKKDAAPGAISVRVNGAEALGAGAPESRGGDGARHQHRVRHLHGGNGRNLFNKIYFANKWLYSHHFECYLGTHGETPYEIQNTCIYQFSR